MKLALPRLLRRGVVAVVAAALALPLAAAPASAATEFSDVPPDHKFYTEITWAAQEGIVSGLSDGTFRPSSTVTRDALAVFLYRLAGSPAVDLPDDSPFTDIDSSTTFYTQMIWMWQEGISGGYSDGTFRPKEEVNRDVMSVFLYRYSGSPDFQAPDTSPYSDMTTGSRFFREVMWMAEEGLSTGYSDGTFRPADSVTRGATVVFLYRIAGSPSVTLPPSGIPDSFTISGSGYGHGVGMSQYGAQAIALAGYSTTRIVQKYYSGASISTVDADDRIQVEIFGSWSDDRDAVDIIARGDWKLSFYTAGRGSAHTVWYGESGERLHVVRSGTGVVVTRDGDETASATGAVKLQWEGTEYYESGSDVEAYVDLYNAGSSTRATHGTYRHGEMRISVPGSRLIVSNRLKLNTEYLYGIAEMPSSWEPAALQAQAIVARGYALRQMGNYYEYCDCHIYDDTRDQNFTGWRKENEGTNAYYGDRWVAAVDATTSAAGADGKVVTYGGSIAQTYYFSSSGGQTENSEDIWSAALPYLRSVDDSWSLSGINPNVAWTRTLSQSTARSVFGLSDVVSIDVTERTSGAPNAAATRVTATSSSGATASITGAESIRARLVGSQSPWIWSFTPNY